MTGLLEGEADGGRLVQRARAGPRPIPPQRRLGQPRVDEHGLVGFVRRQVTEPVLQLLRLFAGAEHHEQPADESARAPVSAAPWSTHGPPSSKSVVKPRVAP